MIQEVYNLKSILKKIKGFASSDGFRLTLHGQCEMAEENIKLDEVQEAITTGEIIENYPRSTNVALVVYSVALLKAEETFIYSQTDLVFEKNILFFWTCR